jgi:hypothetical protein
MRQLEAVNLELDCPNIIISWAAESETRQTHRTVVGSIDIAVHARTRHRVATKTSSLQPYRSDRQVPCTARCDDVQTSVSATRAEERQQIATNILQLA